MGTFSKKYFINIEILEIQNFRMLDQIWKRRAPENDEDPRKQIWEILNMRSISIKKHKMETWYYGLNMFRRHERILLKILHNLGNIPY